MKAEALQRKKIGNQIQKSKFHMFYSWIEKYHEDGLFRRTCLAIAPFAFSAPGMVV